MNNQIIHIPIRYMLLTIKKTCKTKCLPYLFYKNYASASMTLIF